MVDDIVDAKNFFPSPPTVHAFSLTAFPTLYLLFIASRAQHELQFGIPCSYLRAVDPKHNHLRWKTPPWTSNILKPLEIEWFFMRLRVNRPPFRLKQARFGDRQGNCCNCPDIPLTSQHLIAECPRFIHARDQLMDFLSRIHLPRSLQTILTQGASTVTTTTKIRKLLTANIRRFLERILRDAQI